VFTRVDAKHAGPSAIGVLVPPGAKTLVIVRPRALEWDLLAAQWDGESTHAPRFCVFTRDEAAAVARRFITALEGAVVTGTCPVQTFGAEAARQIWLRTDEFVWIVCRRASGQAYQPIVFASAEEAACAAEQLIPIVCPPADVAQQYYFNTQNFT
jgi:hypothetical protein